MANMKNITKISTLTISVFLIIAFFVISAKPEDRTTASAKHNPVSRLLADFADAVHARDAEKAESLFLPPDDTIEGINRRDHIREMKEDWNQAQDQEAEMSVQFTNTTVLVETEMNIRGEEAKPNPIPVRFKISFDPNRNCKIASMEYIKE